MINQHLSDADRWLDQRGPYNSEVTEALVRRLAHALRCALVAATRLDRRADAAANAALTALTDEDATDLLARAASYQECAGLIREALK